MTYWTLKLIDWANLTLNSLFTTTCISIISGVLFIHFNRQYNFGRTV